MPDEKHTGLPVSGYKPQSADKVALVNEFKADEERLLRKIEALINSGTPDYRWASIAKTHFQEGFMALNRAVFQPGRVTLPEDASEELDFEDMPQDDRTVAQQAAATLKGNTIGKDVDA